MNYGSKKKGKTMAIYNVIGSKGGIGKTTISAYMAEYLMSKGKEVIGIDTDPENHSFYAYKGIKTTNIELKDEFNNISNKVFDDMIDFILTNKDKDIVIDNGSNSFNALITYMAQEDIIEFFKDEKIEHIIVGIVAGAGNTRDSLNGLKTLLDNFNTKFLVFNNQLLGRTHNQETGQEIQDSKVIQENKEKILGLINIERKADYQQNEILDKSAGFKLFSELNADENLKMMHKRRLNSYRDKIYAQIDIALNGENK